LNVRITELKTTIVSVPYTQAEKWSGAGRGGLTSVIVEVTTADGLTGVGEATGCSGGTVEPVRAAIESARPLLLGLDAFAVEAFTQRFYGAARWHAMRPFANQALAGIEIAMWDLIGQACGQPVHRLMGGALRDEILCFGYLSQPAAPEALAQQALAYVEAGYTTVYLKVGLGAGIDVRSVQAVRQAIGDRARLRVDATEAWDAGTAIQMIRKLEQFDLEFVEQPTPRRDIAALAHVRRNVGVPIAANQTIWSEQDVIEMIRREAADVIVTGPLWAGGLTGLKKIAWLAEAAGLRFCRHCIDLGVGTAAGAQVLATLPNLMDGNQILLERLSGDVVRAGELDYRDGKLKVPARPGIGVTLDAARLAQHHAYYQAHGEFLPYTLDSAGQIVSSA
jgi:L-alanine-DL-glutamate epimerase-like enolase superfamily enzyme